MKTWSFYDASTGAISPRRLVSTDPEMVRFNTPDGHTAIEGHFDHLSQRVDLETGLVIDWQPPKPSQDHEWDDVARRWKLAAHATERAARRQAALDRIALLESQQPRALRELALGREGAKERLEAIDEQIAAARVDLA